MQRISKIIPIQKIEYVDYVCPNCGNNLFYSSSSNREDNLMKLSSRDKYHCACTKCKTIFWDRFIPHFEITLEDGKVINFER